MNDNLIFKTEAEAEPVFSQLFMRIPGIRRIETDLAHSVTVSFDIPFKKYFVVLFDLNLAEHSMLLSVMEQICPGEKVDILRVYELYKAAQANLAHLNYLLGKLEAAQDAYAIEVRLGIGWLNKVVESYLQ